MYGQVGQPAPIQAPQYNMTAPLVNKGNERFMPVSAWKDPWWAVLFLVHLVTMCVLAIKWSPFVNDSFGGDGTFWVRGQTRTEVGGGGG